MADPEKEPGEKNEKNAKVPSPAAIARAIEGLQFRTNKELPVLDDSTGKPLKENGKVKMRYVPDLRPMTAKDVLSAGYDGDGALVIVAKDGSKYRSEKG